MSRGSGSRSKVSTADLRKPLSERTRKLQERDREVAELLAQQEATADILRVISGSPADIKSVFDIIVASAARLCEANFAFLMLYQEQRLALAAHTNCTPEFAEFLAKGLELDRTTTSGRAAMQRSPVQILDFLADSEVFITEGHRAEPVRTVLAVPMVRGDTLLGVISIWRREVRAFTPQQTRLLETFGNQAIIAIENARLFDAIRDKTRELELANTYKSRFLAAASHDLRQPLHALNLFVSQLRADVDAADRNRLVTRIDAAVNAMNELFDALLDMSKLDAGVLAPSLSDFPIQKVLDRMQTTFADAARERGLRLTVVASNAWIRSDFILLERILLNLVSNAVRYTTRGGVTVGCRRRGARVRIDVWDSGLGIPDDQKQNIFGEFYQLASDDAHHRGGLGLGLALVDRLGSLLHHPVEVASVLGKGSRFSVSVPLAVERQIAVQPLIEPTMITERVKGKLILVIDDDALVLEGMQGILESWGCSVATARSDAEALTRLAQLDRTPALIISDYRLEHGKSGIEAIESVRCAIGLAIPAFLISGDTAPERLRDAAASNYILLHKPVPPMTLRAVVSRLLKSRPAAGKTAEATRAAS